MIDIVFPNKNETEFIAMAQKLGISGLIFAYKNKNEFYEKKTEIPITNALFAEPKDIPKSKSIGAPSICAASREAIERGASIVFGFELLEEKEHTHYRKSGLNQVLCKIATDKKVAIGFSFSSILNVFAQKRAQLLGRIMQNIMFCQKYKTPMKIASFATTPFEMRAPAELASFFHQLGMHQEKIRNALK
jgi:hypothetical protein